MDIKQRIAENAALTDAALSECLHSPDPATDKLYEAMRYSTMSGGKRIRPFLTLEFSRLFGGTDEAAMPFACAIECVHSSSLIHDDMPCMDNDALRRGKPTNHIVFGEDIALLAGDALITRGYELAARNDRVAPEIALSATAMLLRDAGGEGMAGGQQIDLDAEKTKPDFETLCKMHRKKTGALIRAAALLGVHAAGITDPQDARYRAAEAYAAGIGLAFQIVDDILDVEGDAATLGKNTHMDAEMGKTTFLSFMTVSEARAYAQKATDEAIEAIRPYAGAETLIALAEYLLTRKN